VFEVRNVVLQNSQATMSILPAWAGRVAPQLGQLSDFTIKEWRFQWVFHWALVYHWGE
jgi:hypothetical protein